MTYDSTSTEDSSQADTSKVANERAGVESKVIDSTTNYKLDEATETSTKATVDPDEQQATNGNGTNCYNQALDDEIRNRLDKLNALSDQINSLERQFDEANSVFRDTLKCSTNRLSSIAKSLGPKSIKQGRVYHEARLSVEQSQSDCQRACIQFEQANQEHQFAKMAIKKAELRLKEIAGETSSGITSLQNAGIDSIHFDKLNLSQDLETKTDPLQESCDKHINLSDEKTSTIRPETTMSNQDSSSTSFTPNLNTQFTEDENEKKASSDIKIRNSAKLSEDLNQAIMVLIEAERKRGHSEMLHLDRANKLMIAQENLMKLEREHGLSIRRSQLYFDEAKRFNAKLNSVKSDICRISENILAAKQSYAQTLRELEQFSDDLHDNTELVTN